MDWYGINLENDGVQKVDNNNPKEELNLYSNQLLNLRCFRYMYSDFLKENMISI